MASLSLPLDHWRITVFLSFLSQLVGNEYNVKYRILDPFSEGQIFLVSQYYTSLNSIPLAHVLFSLSSLLFF